MKEWLGSSNSGTYGKLFLTLFRIAAVGGIGLVVGFAKKKSSDYLIVAISLIL
jgi:signal peptidase II